MRVLLLFKIYVFHTQVQFCAYTTEDECMTSSRVLKTTNLLGTGFDQFSVML